MMFEQDDILLVYWPECPDTGPIDGEGFLLAIYQSGIENNLLYDRVDTWGNRLHIGPFLAGKYDNIVKIGRL